MAFLFPSSDAVTGGGLFPILGLAVLGGLVLNLMPCVLPVLSIKLIGVVSKGGKNSREVRLGFLASSAGILFTFLLLAGVTIIAKVAGVAIAWGVQFQHPLFLVALALVCVLFAAIFGICTKSGYRPTSVARSHTEALIWALSATS
jgi:suppressor for copper-sensitivity B